MRKALISIAIFVFLMAGTSFSFHDGGVAHCDGCHTMHNSENGQLVDPNSPTGNPWLLNDGTVSDVCLNCHMYGPINVMAFNPMSPRSERGAGDFIFLIEDNLNDGYGGGDTLSDGSWANAIPGYKGGHSIIATGHGLNVDPTAFPGNAGPGGSYSKYNLGCSSCHDPHGNENFRLLNGIGPIQGSGYSFTAPAPIASGFWLYFGGDEAGGDGTVYTSGMSDWCSNCHADMHTASAGGNLIHLSGIAMGNTIATAYGLYNGSDDQTGGNPTTSFIPQVPFEGFTRTSTGDAFGPDASSTVSCITCHRAHASSAPNIGRWDFNISLLEEDGVNSGSFALPNPYSNNQRSLCNKCHVKDAGDHMPN